MVNKPEVQEIEIIWVIVNFEIGNKIIKKSKEQGVLGGTVMLGKGTTSNKYLNFIGISDARLEIVVMIADKNIANKTLEKLNSLYKFDEPNHGIAFTTSICGVMGTRCFNCDNINKERGVENIMYHVITIFVDKGKAEDVIDAATKAGAKGGTIINGRGSGIHETSKLFSMDIEPEKEIVIILSKVDKTENIVSSIRTNLKMDEPGNGIIYVQDIKKAYGVAE